MQPAGPSLLDIHDSDDDADTPPPSLEPLHGLESHILPPTCLGQGDFKREITKPYFKPVFLRAKRCPL